MEKHPKVGRNLVLSPRKYFRDTDNPAPIKVAATCELDVRTCPAAILYPSTNKAQAYIKFKYTQSVFHRHMGKTFIKKYILPSIINVFMISILKTNSFFIANAAT